MSDSSWCPDCHRMIGVGCNCHMPFIERMKSTYVNLGTFRAVGSHA